MLPPITWTEDSEQHIAHHNVEPQEVQDVLYNRPRWTTTGARGVTLVYGTTRSGRYLLVVTAEAPDSGIYIVTARDMTDTEKKTFKRKGT